MGIQQPVNAGISSSWQDHKNRRPPSSEPGTDYACAYGTDILAAEDGVVADLKLDSGAATGRYLTLDLDNGQRVRYLHLSRILVNRGQRVGRGQVVAKSGASAYGKDWGLGAHVHATLWPSHKYVFGASGTLDFHAHVGPRAAAPAPAGNPGYADAGGAVQAQGGGYNPFGIAWSAGLQKIAKLYGYTGPIDQKFGDGSKAGFAEFLRRNWGYVGNNVLGPVMWAAIARWLRARWGYKGNDVPGPVMRAALSRAEAENYKAL